MCSDNTKYLRSSRKVWWQRKEGFLLGYSTNSKGHRVYNKRTRKVEDCLQVDFLEEVENKQGKGPDWMFNLDFLTTSIKYYPVCVENQDDAGSQV